MAGRGAGLEAIDDVEEDSGSPIEPPQPPNPFEETPNPFEEPSNPFEEPVFGAVPVVEGILTLPPGPPPSDTSDTFDLQPQPQHRVGER